MGRKTIVGTIKTHSKQKNVSKKVSDNSKSNGIRIIAKTKKGSDIINKIINNDDGKYDDVIKNIFTETIEHNNPLTISIKYKSNMHIKLFNQRQLSEIICKQMISFGAKKNIDYEVQFL